MCASQVVYCGCSWDEWVPESRVLKLNDTSRQKQKELQAAHMYAFILLYYVSHDYDDDDDSVIDDDDDLYNAADWTEMLLSK